MDRRVLTRPHPEGGSPSHRSYALDHCTRHSPLAESRITLGAMGAPNEAAVQRFRRRTDGTSVAMLYRNLRAGVYGPTGSTRREVAEVALELRLAERSQALQEGTTENATALDRRVERAFRAAQRAKRISIAALVLTLLALARGFGLI